MNNDDVKRLEQDSLDEAAQSFGYKNWKEAELLSPDDLDNISDVAFQIAKEKYEDWRDDQ